MGTINKETCKRLYGEEFVQMDKETAVKIITEHSDYANKEVVCNKIRRSRLAPYTFVPPEAYERYRSTLVGDKI